MIGAIDEASGTVDLTPPAAPTNLHVTGEAANQLAVAWTASVGAAGYDVRPSSVHPIGGLEPIRSAQSSIHEASAATDSNPLLTFSAGDA